MIKRAVRKMFSKPDLSQKTRLQGELLKSEIRRTMRWPLLIGVSTVVISAIVAVTLVLKDALRGGATYLREDNKGEGEKKDNKKEDSDGDSDLEDGFIPGPAPKPTPTPTPEPEPGVSPTVEKVREATADVLDAASLNLPLAGWLTLIAGETIVYLVKRGRK